MKEKYKNGKALLMNLMWLDKFRVKPQGHIYLKSALCKGEKIGVYNQFDKLKWFDRNIEVRIIND